MWPAGGQDEDPEEGDGEKWTLIEMTRHHVILSFPLHQH